MVWYKTVNIINLIHGIELVYFIWLQLPSNILIHLFLNDNTTAFALTVCHCLVTKPDKGTEKCDWMKCLIGIYVCLHFYPVAAFVFIC